MLFSQGGSVKSPYRLINVSLPSNIKCASGITSMKSLI